MLDITHKSNTIRKATSQAIVRVSKQETIDAIINKTVPKGCVFEMSKAAGLFAAKNTANVIPDCHPIPIESTTINYNINNLDIYILVEIKTIYKTGVEVEAMHSASIVALTIYDMLKPIDKQIEILNIRLLEKTGGKSRSDIIAEDSISSAVVVCSDSIAKGKKEDTSGKTILEKLKHFKINDSEYIIIPDEKSIIQDTVKDLVRNKFSLIIITGGTGLSKRDVTPEAVKPLLEREIPGIAETIRNYGQNRMPYSMLSRSIAGLMGNSLIIALPGSTRGASESMDAICPYVLHIFKIIKNIPH